MKTAGRILASLWLVATCWVPPRRNLGDELRELWNDEGDGPAS